MCRQGCFLRGAGGYVDDPAARLTTRDVQILTLVADGLSDKAIARVLDRAPSTISNHVSSIFVKLGAHTRAQAIAIALNENLITLDRER